MGALHLHLPAEPRRRAAEEIEDTPIGDRQILRADIGRGAGGGRGAKDVITEY